MDSDDVLYNILNMKQTEELCASNINKRINRTSADILKKRLKNHFLNETYTDEDAIMSLIFNRLTFSIFLEKLSKEDMIFLLIAFVGLVQEKKGNEYASKIILENSNFDVKKLWARTVSKLRKSEVCDLIMYVREAL